MRWKTVELIEKVSKTEFLHSNLRGAKDAKRILNPTAAGQPADRTSTAESGMSRPHHSHPAGSAAGVLDGRDNGRNHETQHLWKSAIGALQSGNGMERCRDCSAIGFERYVSLAILGRNVQTLGRLLIAMACPESEAALSRRKAG